LTDIAADLSVSVKTISTHKTRLQQKLGLANQTELVKYAIEHKLLD
jgi:DNA-binding NarL/FixJ family response regulator